MGGLRCAFRIQDYDAQKDAAMSNGYFLTAARTACSSSTARTLS